jgi:hypothetical protein
MFLLPSRNLKWNNEKRLFPSFYRLVCKFILSECETKEETCSKNVVNNMRRMTYGRVNVKTLLAHVRVEVGVMTKLRSLKQRLINDISLSCVCFVMEHPSSTISQKSVALFDDKLMCCVLDELCIVFWLNLLPKCNVILRHVHRYLPDFYLWKSISKSSPDFTEKNQK